MSESHYREERDIKVVVSHDTDLVFLFLAALLAWGLCTKPGNAYMCKEDLAPSFISCPTAPAQSPPHE